MTRPPLPRWGLAARAALAMAVVVTIALLLTGVVAIRLVQGAAESQALDTLDRLADVVGDVTERSPNVLQNPGRFPSRRLIRGQEVRLVGVTEDGVAHGAAAPALRPADRDALTAGRRLRGVRTLDGERMLVSGRPVSGGGIALVQNASVAQGVTADARRRILAALLVGLVGAAISGMVLARRLARPLQQAATAAHEIARGAREVRLPASGPVEVAELAAALNALAAALAHSEGRQREFLLSVSHELRTPLTAIKGFAEALADDVVPSGDVPRAGGTMLAEASRLERLVSDLLDLARLGADDFRIELAPVEVGALVRSAADAWRPRCARPGVALRVELATEPLHVRTDATRLRQVLDGLADNALRVTPAGAPIVFAVRRDGTDVVLEVRDGGPGLTEDDLAVAFERSALYDRYRGVRRVGTGVGLALVAGLVARLGGRVEAGHAAEGGARFTVRLPAAPSTPSPAPAAAPAVRT